MGLRGIGVVERLHYSALGIAIRQTRHRLNLARGKVVIDCHEAT
jgi:hypothetical protein